MSIRKRINDWAVCSLSKIPNDDIGIADFALSNAACHANDVAAVRADRADKVWLVWAGGEKGVVHFINSKDGVHFDETWHYYKNQDYRIIRLVEPSEHDDVYDILVATKRHLIAQHGSLIDKIKAKLGFIHNII